MSQAVKTQFKYKKHILLWDILGLRPNGHASLIFSSLTSGGQDDDIWGIYIWWDVVEPPPKTSNRFVVTGSCRNKMNINKLKIAIM